MRAQVDHGEFVGGQPEQRSQFRKLLLASLGRKERVHARKIVTFQNSIQASERARASTWAGLGWLQGERGRRTPQQTSPAAASPAPAMGDASVTRHRLSQLLHALRRPARTSMGLRRSRSSSSASMTRDMKGASTEASRAGAGEDRQEEEAAAAAAGDDAVAGDDDAAGEASASISSFSIMALPRVRPKLLRPSTVILTSTLLVMLSLLRAACECAAHVAHHTHTHFNTRTGTCSVLWT